MDNTDTVRWYEEEKRADGYLYVTRYHTWQEVFNDLARALRALPDDAEPDGSTCPVIDEYFSPGWYTSEKRANEPVPRARWIACYAVTGGSEGHYIHVDLIVDGGADGYERHAIPLALGKTFRGMAHAQRIASLCAAFLGA